MPTFIQLSETLPPLLLLPQLLAPSLCNEIVVMCSIRVAKKYFGSILPPVISVIVVVSVSRRIFEMKKTAFLCHCNTTYEYILPYI